MAREGRFFCVYCEKDFPAGTPIQELKDHVVICKKHPLAEVKIALEESVRLQSHYADLLNMHDGGQRIVFKSADEWVRRLREIGKTPKIRKTPKD